MFDVSSPRTWAAVATIVATRGLRCCAPVRLGRRDLGQFVVAGGERDADERDLVGHVDREERQDRGALVLAERAQPAVRGPGIAGGHRLQGEQPCRLAAEVRRAVLEQAPCESGRSLLQAPVALMQRDSPQGDDARGVKGADEAVAGLRAELPFEDRAGVVEPAQLVQLPAAPDLEDADPPAVSVALGRRDAVGGQPQRVVHVVQHGAGLAAPLLGEALARPVGRADAGARRLLGHLERVVVAPVDVGGDGLGEGERERRVRHPRSPARPPPSRRGSPSPPRSGRRRAGCGRARRGAGRAACARQLGQRERLSARGDPRVGRERGTCPRCRGAPRPPAPPAARRADACRRTRAPRRRGPRNGAGRRSGRGAARAGRGRAAPAPARAG